MRNTYKIREDLFENWSKTEAYLLAYLFSRLYPVKNEYVLHNEIRTQAPYLLDIMTGLKDQSYHGSVIAPDKVVEFLHQQGFGDSPRKGRFPDLDDKYHSHFMRGIFEWGRRIEHPRNSSLTTWIYPNFRFARGILEIIEGYCPHTNFEFDRYIQSITVENTLEFYEFIYRDAFASFVPFNSYCLNIFPQSIFSGRNRPRNLVLHSYLNRCRGANECDLKRNHWGIYKRFKKYGLVGLLPSRDNEILVMDKKSLRIISKEMKERKRRE